MAPLTRKRKLVEHDDIEDVALAGHGSESEADIALPLLHQRTSSKNLEKKNRQGEEAVRARTSRSLFGASKKERKNTQDIKLALQGIAEDLKAYIKTEVCPEDFPNQMLNISQLATESIPDDVASIMPYLCSSYTGQASATTNDSYEIARRALGGFLELTKHYEELSTCGIDDKMPSLLRWKQDCTDLHLLNTTLMGHAAKLVEQNMVPKAAGARPDVGDGDVDQIAMELLEDVKPPKSSGTWGDVAEGILQTMYGMASFLA